MARGSPSASPFDVGRCRDRRGSDQAAQHFNKPAALSLRPDRDAQEVLDARLSEMPDQNATLPKCCREICSAPASMTREDEVCERRQHLEAELSKLAGQRFAACDLEVAARKIRDPPARFFDNQYARRRIPWIEIKFPEAIKPARRHIAKIKRS